MQNASGLVQRRTISANCCSVARNTMGSGNKGISLINTFSFNPCCSSFAFTNTCRRGSPVERGTSNFWRFACLPILYTCTLFLGNSPADSTFMIPPRSSTIEWITWRGGSSFDFSLTHSRVLSMVLLKGRDVFPLQFPWLFTRTSCLPSVKVYWTITKSWGDVDVASCAVIIGFRNEVKLLLAKNWHCTTYNAWSGG